MMSSKRIFPLPVRQKQTRQQGFPLRKLTVKQKLFYRKSQRVFSLEYGRYLQKRILWKIVNGQKLANPKRVPQPTVRTLFLNAFHHVEQNKQNLLTKIYHSLLKPSKLPFTKSSPNKMPLLASANARMTTKMKTFHAMVLHKKWQLDNASLVPGMVWPLKSKRVLVAKMRAFKSLSHLVQARNQYVFTKMLQKLWNLQSQTKPSVWSVASGIDSLKAQVLLKAGFVPTYSAGKHVEKHTRFYYPGDWISSDPKQLSLLFHAGPKVVFLKKDPKSRRHVHSIYSKTPFLWAARFYQTKYMNPNKTKKSFFIL